MMKKVIDIMAVPVISVLASFLAGAILIAAVGENPIYVYWIFLKNSFFDLNGFGYTLFYATPLIFTGLAVAFGFRCGLFNIGGEGQLYMGAMAITAVALWMDGTSAWIMIPVLFVTGFLAGGIWGGIPGVLKAQFGGHEVINTIMMNFIAYSIVNYLVLGPLKREGTQVLETSFIPDAGKIPKFNEWFSWIPETQPLNAGFIVALITCALVYVILWKTKWGFEIRSVGISNTVAKYAGIGVKKNMILAMFLSGGFAGMVGIHEVMGFRHTFHDSFANQAGFVGIAVALLGRNHPVGVILAAILFGALNRGSLFLDIEFDSLSRDLVMVLQGIIVLFVATDQLFRGLLKKKKKAL